MCSLLFIFAALSAEPATCCRLRDWETLSGCSRHLVAKRTHLACINCRNPKIEEKKTINSIKIFAFHSLPHVWSLSRPDGGIFSLACLPFAQDTCVARSCEIFINEILNFKAKRRNLCSSVECCLLDDRFDLFILPREKMILNFEILVMRLKREEQKHFNVMFCEDYLR